MHSRPLTLLALMLVPLVGTGCKLRKKPPPSNGALTQSYVSENGLITVHYPADFAAKKLGNSVVLLSRNLGDGTDEAIAYAPIETPISDDLNEFARVVELASTKDLNRYTEKSREPASCGAAEGLEVVGRWVPESGRIAYERRACIFFKNGHGFAFSYSFPESRAGEERPLLKKIVESTQINR
jgi:hypothetical protein